MVVVLTRIGTYEILITPEIETDVWDVRSIETVAAGGDGLQEVAGDKATALK